MLTRLLLPIALLALSTACDRDESCQDVEAPVCDAGWEAIVKSHDCVSGTGEISGITAWICVPEGIGDPCEATTASEDCGDDLVCTGEPGQADFEFGTCLPLCTTLEGDCELLGYEWECVTTSNGPDVCAADYAQ